MTSKNIISIPYCNVTSKSMTFQKNTSFRQWQAVGLRLGQLGGSLLLLVGDWCVFGEDHFGEEYAQAIDEIGYSHETLRVAAWVAKRFPPDKRPDGISFSHLRIVSKIEDNKKVGALLARVIKEGLSVSELKELVAKAGGKAGVISQLMRTITCPFCKKPFDIEKK